MACATSEQLLIDWGFEDLIPSFKEQDIDEECLLALNPNHIRDLIPTIGKRAKFEKKLKEFLSSRNEDQSPEQSLTEFPTECTPAKILKIDNNQKTENPPGNFQESSINFDITETLNKSSCGQFVLASYHKEKCLNARSRQKLVEIVVQETIDRRLSKSSEVRCKVHNHEWDEIASNIVKTFPKEVKQTYYVPPLQEGSNQKISKGKLVDKFRNSLRELRKVGLVPSSGSSKTLLPLDSQIVEDPSLEEHKTWLKHNREPWPLVLDHWNKSRACRQCSNEEKSVAEILEAWPILRQPLGYSLLESDFCNKNPEQEYQLFNNFSKFVDNIVKNSTIKDKRTLELMNIRSKEEVDQNVKDVCSLMILPAVCPPSRVKISKNKQGWKPSIIESQEGFLLHVKTANDMIPSITRKQEKMKNMGLTVQPFVIIVGNHLEDKCESYVSIDDVLYKVETPLKAIDVCFKGIHVLHAKYAPESTQVWMLLQLGVYKMKTPWDRQIPSVNGILSSLSSLNDEQ